MRPIDGAALFQRKLSAVPVVEKLRALGYDVLTIQETGKANQAVPDDKVLEFAATENRALLTLNRRHFIRLHREHPQHAGIVIRSSKS